MKKAKRFFTSAGLFCLICLLILFAACGETPLDLTSEKTSMPFETTGNAATETTVTITTENTAATARTEAITTLPESTEITSAEAKPAVTTAETTVAVAETSTSWVETTATSRIEMQNSLEFVLAATLPYGVEYEYDDARYDDEETVLRQGQDGTTYHIFSVSPFGEREFITAVETPPVSRLVRRGTRPASEISELTVRGDTVTYAVEYTYDSTLPEGERRTLTLGKEGYTEVILLVTVYHGQEISREVLSEKVVSPKNEIIVIGTKKKKETFGMPYIDAAHGGEDYAVTQYFGGSNSHGGVDFAVYYGREIVSVMSGTVIAAYDEGDFGKSDLRWTYGTYVTVEHANGMRSTYAHLKDRAVSVGDTVSKGQLLGHSGNTGRVSPSPTAGNPLAGTHLHFELRILENGIYQKTDPTWYLPRWDQ